MEFYQIFEKFKEMQQKNADSRTMSKIQQNFVEFMREQQSKEEPPRRKRTNRRRNSNDRERKRNEKQKQREIA